MMNLSVIVKGQAGCNGTLSLITCAMVPATLGYQVVITNGSVQLDRGYGYEDDVVVGYYSTPGYGGWRASDLSWRLCIGTE